MPRIAGIDIPENKNINIALTYIYGIGNSMSEKILKEAKIDVAVKSGKLSADEVNRLRDIIEKRYQVEGALRQSKIMNIKRLKEIKCYRGVRHIKGLPVRGQRTKTNTRTIRGNVRKTMGSGRRAVDKT
ncbi:MAG: 30S ribosomal protein S13 [Candidatus Portnoybacteria bacterium CG10_big_fil_rev_8_21_14_0_10_36_7]|uniref:Small ribosomal subunit protein uS13 n=1 Tax=Candidatus Portnoybacteria bacterium CG10_big_fil_rev_8_21_14_0_10_36_7 TaxID=1974812 RepID=A0A2M8KEH9_9BACT|nr:MAG: 30S ribosomal protein S13 [Candidatus Portnoybacteria bacterium CG10_big_fil_rev_8_21_14_0_10_36_7]